MDPNRRRAEPLCYTTTPPPRRTRLPIMAGTLAVMLFLNLLPWFVQSTPMTDAMEPLLGWPFTFLSEGGYAYHRRFEPAMLLLDLTITAVASLGAMRLIRR